MGTYLVRRLLTALPVLIGISLVLFTILALAPGDPFGELATNPNVPPEVRANLRKQFGLDDPVAVRYVRWFSSMLKGDWGYSFVSRVNVDVLIKQRLVTTLFVLGTAQILALLIAIPVGVLSARRPYSFFDQVATTLGSTQQWIREQQQLYGRVEDLLSEPPPVPVLTNSPAPK